jgi:hypothetical protein
MGAETFVGIEVEDDRDQRGLRLVDGEASLPLDRPVAEGFVSAAPTPLGGLALHAGDHPVDDGGPLDMPSPRICRGGPCAFGLGLLEVGGAREEVGIIAAM